MAKEEIKPMEEEDIKLHHKHEEIVDAFMKIKKELKEKDRKNAEEQKRIECGKYWSQRVWWK